MKQLQVSTIGTFSRSGIFTHCGDYASKYQNEAIEILMTKSDSLESIFDGEGWADIMINENTGEVFAVWANDSLTAQNGICECIKLDYEDCPRAFDEWNAKQPEAKF